MTSPSRRKLTLGPGEHLRPDELRALTFEAPELTDRYARACEHVKGCQACEKMVSLERAENPLYRMMENASDKDAFWAAVEEAADEDARAVPLEEHESPGTSTEDCRPEGLGLAVWHQLRDCFARDLDRFAMRLATSLTATGPVTSDETLLPFNLRVRQASLAVGLHVSRAMRVQALGSLLSPLPRLLAPVLARALPHKISDFVKELPALKVGIASRSTRSAEDIRRTLGPSPAEMFMTHDIQGVSKCLEGLTDVSLVLVDAALPGFADLELPAKLACGFVVVGSANDEETCRRRFGGSPCYGFVRSPFQAYELLKVAATTVRSSSVPSAKAEATG